MGVVQCRRRAGVQALTAIGKAELARQTKNGLIAVIPNVVEPLRGPAIASSDRSGLVTVGRLDVYQKGLDLLLRAFAASGGAKERGRLKLIGPGSRAERESLVSLARSLGIDVGRDISITGYVSDDEKARLVSNARYYIQLSRFEGFGLSVAEALSLGVPPIVTSSIPISGLIESYSAGYVVDNAADVPSVLAEVALVSQADYETMSSQAHRLFREQFDADRAIRKLLSFYTEVLDVNRDAHGGRCIGPN